MASKRRAKGTTDLHGSHAANFPTIDTPPRERDSSPERFVWLSILQFLICFRKKVIFTQQVARRRVGMPLATVTGNGSQQPRRVVKVHQNVAVICCC